MILDPFCFISHFSWEIAFLLFLFTQLSEVLGQALTAKQDSFFAGKKQSSLMSFAPLFTQ